jgi:hypothetical protein
MPDTFSPQPSSPLPLAADTTITMADLVYLDDLQPETVEWLWEYRLAVGTLAMFSGVPGSGKTWVALAIAAALTNGRDPFSGSDLTPVTVLYASSEHAPSQIIQPRFAALKGNSSRLVVLRTAVPAGSALRELDNAYGEPRPAL